MAREVGRRFGERQHVGCQPAQISGQFRFGCDRRHHRRRAAAVAWKRRRNSSSACAGRCRRRARTEGAATSEIPRQERRARRARRTAAGRRDAGKPARRRHHADREILHPQQRADSRTRRRIPTPGRSPSTARSNNKLEITLGELKSKYKAVTRRMVLECGGNGRSALLAAGARQPVDQWRRGLRRMDRRARSPTC